MSALSDFQDWIELSWAGFSWSILLYVIESGLCGSSTTCSLFQLKYSSLCDWISTLLFRRHHSRAVSVEVFFSMWLNPVFRLCEKSSIAVSVEVFFSMWLNPRTFFYGQPAPSFQLKYSSLCDWIKTGLIKTVAPFKVSVEVFFSMWLNRWAPNITGEHNGTFQLKYSSLCDWI